MSAAALTFEILWLDAPTGEGPAPVIGTETVQRHNLDEALAAASNRLYHQRGKAAAARGFVVRLVREEE